MFSQIVTWMGNALGAILLIRLYREDLYRKYPIFYAYLSYVFVMAFLRFSVSVLEPTFFPRFYWYTEFPSIAIGYAVIFEIYRQAFAHYPGVARIIRYFLLIIFVLIVAIAAVGGFSDPANLFHRVESNFERNLRAVQAILLITALASFIYFEIPTGRNLRGIMGGYTLYIGTSVVNLAFLTFSIHLPGMTETMWNYFRRVSYILALVTWCVSLWSYAPNPVPRKDSRVEEQYEFIVAQVRKTLARIRSRFGKGLEL